MARREQELVDVSSSQASTIREEEEVSEVILMTFAVMGSGLKPNQHVRV